MTHGGYPVAVDRQLREHEVDAGHDILSVAITPRAPRSPEKLLAVARRAAEVHLKHEVAVRREVLILEVEGIAIGGVRSTMTAHDQRISNVGSIVVRMEEPSFDGRAILAVEADARAFVEGNLARERVVNVRDLTLIRSIGVGDVYLTRRFILVD